VSACSRRTPPVPRAGRLPRPRLPRPRLRGPAALPLVPAGRGDGDPVVALEPNVVCGSERPSSSAAGPPNSRTRTTGCCPVTPPTPMFCCSTRCRRPAAPRWPRSGRSPDSACPRSTSSSSLHHGAGGHRGGARTLARRAHRHLGRRGTARRERVPDPGIGDFGDRCSGTDRQRHVAHGSRGAVPARPPCALRGAGVTRRRRTGPGRPRGTRTWWRARGVRPAPAALPTGSTSNAAARPGGTPARAACAGRPRPRPA
jgi:hypothetical protein